MASVAEIKKKLKKNGISGDVGTASKDYSIGNKTEEEEADIGYIGSDRYQQIKDKLKSEGISLDSDYINTFITDANNFFSTIEDDYNSLGWSNASSAYSTKAKTWSDLDTRASTISKWLEHNKNSIDEEAYNNLYTTIDSIKGGATSALDAFGKAKDYYAQFKTENEYKDAVKLNELYSMSSSELLPYLSKGEPIAYTTSSGQNITWKKLYDEKKKKEEAEALYKGLSSSDDWEEYVNKGANIENPTTKEAEGWWSIGPWRFGAKDVGNIVTYSRDNAAFITLGDMNGTDLVGDSRYTLMTDEEVNVYNYYLAKYGNEKASEYLQSIDRDLTDRYEGKLLEGIMQVAAERPVLASVYSVPMNLFAGAEYIKDAVDYAKTGELDTNFMAEASSAIRGTVSDKVDWEIGNWDAFDFLYNTGMSAADSVASMGLLGNAGGVALGLSAATQGTNDALNRGMSNRGAFWSGFWSGVFEGLFETVSIGQFNVMKEAASTTIKQIAKNVGKTMLVNATEETATEIANIAYDTIINGDFSQAETAIRQYVQNGMSEAEAKRKVALELGAQIVEAGASGALMGFGFGVVGSGSNYIKGSIASKNAYGDGTGLVNEALNFTTEGSEARTLAEGFQKKLDDGKKLSGANLYALNEAIKSNDTDLIKNSILRRLGDLGETTDVTPVAETLVKYAMGEKLGSKDMAILNNSDKGHIVLAELNKDNIQSGGLGNKWAQNIGTRRINPESYNKDLYDLAKAVAGFKEAVEKESVSKTATEEKSATATKFEASDGGETIVTSTGENVSVKGVASIKGGTLMLELDNGKTVNAKDVSFGSKDDALVYEMVTDMEVSPKTANTLIKGFKAADGVSAEAYKAYIPLAYKYGLMNYKAGLDNLDLTAEQKNTAFVLGRDEAKTLGRTWSNTSRKANDTTTAKASEDGIIYEGFELNEDSLTEIQKASLAGVRTIAKMSSLEIHVYEGRIENGVRYAVVNGKKRKAPNGYFRDGNRIYLDINAGSHSTGTMLYTLSHEVVHYIAENSYKDFKALADFLFENYGKNGVPVDALINREIDKLKASYKADKKALPSEKVLYMKAYEEVVADSMSRMLADPNVYDKLAKLKSENHSLWQKIGEAIKMLLDKLKSLLGVYSDLTPDAMASHYVDKFSKEVYNKLQDLYVKAFVQADANFESANRALAESGIMVDSKTESATLYSVNHLLDSKQQQKVADTLAERFGVTVQEAKDWITSETSLASLILNPKYSQYLDYNADASEEAIKSNSDYPQGTVDFSNICKKRRDFTEVMNRVLRNFPNHVFAATDLAKIRTIMSEEGMEVACGICYVEDRRQLDSVVAQDFIDSLALYRKGIKTRPDGKAFNANQLKALKLVDGDTYTPSIYELISLEGKNILKAKNPAMEEAWVKFNNARGMQSVRLLLNDAEYKRQILKYSPAVVERKNNLGGLRIYSFSDMEMFHLIDIVQVITDSATVGLSLQGYTKVNEYARAVKDTGEKLNRSLIPKGDLGYHMEKGEVVLDFDTVEGIDINHPDFFDNIDNPNIGNIVIGINDTQIRAAMRSKFIDQIIPFHTGQSGEVLGEKGIASWQNYKDYQSERDVDTGKKSSHQINIYTEVIQAAEKEGHPITNKREFVEKFLEVCKANNLIPRFSQFLNIDENGDYAYTEGYHKFLVDFKTFDQNTGEYLPQMPVKPIFDNAYLTKLLKGYVKTQKSKDTHLAETMPKVLDRITKEVVGVEDDTLFSEADDLPKVTAEMTEEERSNGIAVAEFIENVNQMLDESKRSKRKKRIGLISQNHADAINELMRTINPDFSSEGYELWIDGTGARHIEIRHGKNGKADRTMASKEAKSLIPWAAQNADAGAFIREENGEIKRSDRFYNSDGTRAPEIRLEKTTPDGVVYVSECVPDSANKRIWITSAYANKKSSKGQLLNIEDKSSPQPTPEATFDSNATTGIISQPVNSVKGKSKDTDTVFSEADYAPTFYSHMGKVVDDIRLEKMGAGGVVSYLKGKGVKNEEIKWSGIEAFLEGKKSVTKAELQEFVAGSQLTIEEEMSGYNQEAYDELDALWRQHAGVSLSETFSDDFDLPLTEDNMADVFDDMERDGYDVPSIEDQRRMLELARKAGNEGRWSKYKLGGGKNYRELVFKMPNSSYSNNAMRGHWGQDAEGVLAHARIQDFTTADGKKMLFVEEIQSDWHNEGAKSGYADLQAEREIQRLKEEADIAFYELEDYSTKLTGMAGEYEAVAKTFEGRQLLRQKNKTADALKKAEDAYFKKSPDAPFRTTYHEYVLKRLLRMAAEEGYDSIGWTTADIQSKRWSDKHAEGYRIEYDQDIPKFLRKYGKKWGATVGKTALPSLDPKITLYDVNRQEEYSFIEWQNVVEHELKGQGAPMRNLKYESDDKYWIAYDKVSGEEWDRAEIRRTSGTVWSMDITDSMTESVLYEGQVLYSEMVTDQETLDFLENQDHITTYKSFVEIDGKLYSPMATKVKGDDGKYHLTNPSEIGVWQQAEEKPDSIPKFHKTKGYGYYVLKKDDGGTVTAAYNPYEHSSNLVLNDQFEAAYQRPNLVTVECIIPKSEMTSGYKAKYAKDSTGYLDWKSGTVAGKLKGNKRKVYLSRWLKPVRILSDAEVASMYKDILGAKISVPFNVVTPQLRAELEKVGVKIDYEGSPGYQYRQSKKATDADTMYSEQDPDSVSNRTLLANALESVAQNDIEKNKLKQYKEKIALIEAEQAKLSEIRAKANELRFTKGRTPSETKQMRDLDFEAMQIANRISTYDKQLLSLETTTALKGVLEREKAMLRKRLEKKNKEVLTAHREREAKKTRELLTRHQESRKKALDSRHRTEMRHKIKKVVSDLDHLLRHGSKDRNVKLGLQTAVASALEAVNMDTVAAEERIAKLREELMKAKTPEKIQEISRKIDNIQAQGDRMQSRLEELRQAYADIKASEENIPEYYRSEATLIASKVEDVVKKVGNTPLRNMSLSQLESVYELYRMVLTTVRNTNATFIEGKLDDLHRNASDIMVELESIRKMKEERLGAGGAVNGFSWNEMIPAYAFERIGSKTLTRFFWEAVRGQNTYAVDVNEANEFSTATREKFGYSKWDMGKVHEFKLADGRTFRVTLKHMMSIYAYSKREQALFHMQKGGFFFNDKETFRREKGVLKVIKSNEEGYCVDEAVLQAIKNAMTSEQIQYVDAMQEYLTKMGEKGNEVSRVLWGIDIFKEKVYFPLKSSSDFIYQANQPAQESSLKNDGMTKEVKPGASNPIVLESFDDVWANHVNRMSQYHAFVLPIENLNKVLNYGTWIGTASMAISTMLSARYGSAVNEYLTNFVKDMNGASSMHGASNPFFSMVSKFKKTAVAASMSVVVQQPTAILRALAVMDAKYFVGKPNLAKLSRKWEELKQYAPIAIIKEIGGFDAGAGRQTAEWLNADTKQGIDKVMSKVDDVTMMGAALGDQVGWTSIWEAVKRETKATTNLKEGSEEFFKKAGERFTEVIVKTQVYDSTLSRSGYMRSKHDSVKMLTAFMGEPTVSFNMMFNAVSQAVRKKMPKKESARIIASVYASVVMASVASSLIYALRDDDDDESYLEKFAEAFSDKLLSDINPLNMLPAVRDIMSILDGWDVSRTDMDIFQDIYDAITSLDSENKSAWRKVEDLSGAFASLFGVPLKNTLRTGREIYNLFENIFDGVSPSGVGDAFVRGITGEKKDKGKALYDAIVNGDKARLDIYRKDYKDDKAYVNAVRSALKENDPRIKEAAQARYGGDVAEYTRIAKSIIAEGNFSQDDVVAAINAEINALKKGESTTEPSTSNKVESIYKVDDYYAALVGRDEATAYAVKEDLISTAVANGKDRDEAEAKFRSDFVSHLRSQYEKGDVYPFDAVDMLVKYGGASQEDAETKVNYWDFKKQYPDYDLTESAVSKYYEYAEPSGISVDVYYDFYMKKSKATGTDSDGDGRADTGTKKAEVLAIIDSLSLTSSQKDALYFASGYSQSTLYQAPWR